jgi:hypothetical protein
MIAWCGHIERRTIMAKSAVEFLQGLGVELADEVCETINENLKVKSKKRETVLVQRTDKEVEDKLAPQAKIILGVVPDDEPISLEQWGELAAEAGLQTKQTPERICAYYRKTLIDNGYLATC